MRNLLPCLLFLISEPLFAPVSNTITIIEIEPYNEYESLLLAIYSVESNSGKYLYNEKENAVGPLQIRPIRVRDYNIRTGRNYRHEDFYSYELSRKMFLYYARGKSYEEAAKDWNKSKTDTYWNNVKSKLYNHEKNQQLL